MLDLDRGAFWAAPPDWRQDEIRRDGFMARRISRLSQVLVSGNLAAARNVLARGAPEVGLWQIVDGASYCVRVARDRMLVVSVLPLTFEPGWHSDGWAATPADDLYAVIQLEGRDLERLISEGTGADLAAGSPSASILFAGIPALLYRITPQTAHLHVDASHAAYLWTWLETRLG